MHHQTKTREAIRRMVIIAMFCALAYVAMLVIHIKVVFLTLDVKDAVITLCGLCFGPLSALIVSIIVPVFELAVSSTGYYGLIMNILGSVSFSVTASLIYKYKKTLWGAVVALISGACAMVAVMLTANLFITPLFMAANGMTTTTVREMIPTLLLPFNLLKAITNVGFVLLLYKPTSRALRRAGFLPRATVQAEAKPARARKRLVSIIVSIVAVLLIAASMVLIFTVFKGKFDFGLSK